MRILTLDNQCYSLNDLPSEIEDDVRFAVLDNSDTQNPDFFFQPLIFLESFPSPAMVLDIGGKELMMPIDWSIVVGDSQCQSDLEIIPLTSINDRGFEAFLFNPLSGFKMDFKEVKIVNFYSDVTWYFPKLKNAQLLCVPLDDGHKPQCAYFVKDISRQSEIIDFGKLL